MGLQQVSVDQLPAFGRDAISRLVSLSSPVSDLSALAMPSSYFVSMVISWRHDSGAQLIVRHGLSFRLDKELSAACQQSFIEPR